MSSRSYTETFNSYVPRFLTDHVFSGIPSSYIRIFEFALKEQLVYGTPRQAFLDNSGTISLSVLTPTLARA